MQAHLPSIHSEQNDRIEERVGHCEPVEGQVNVFDRCQLIELWPEVNANEIEMVREPANCKHNNN